MAEKLEPIGLATSSSSNRFLGQDIKAPSAAESKSEDDLMKDDKIARRKKRKRELSRAAHAKQRVEMDNKLVRVVELLKVLKSHGVYEKYVGSSFREKKTKSARGDKRKKRKR